jgi:hypothetical protein
MAVLAPISGMPQFRNGRLVADAVAYFYEAGTTTPRTTYEAAGGSEHEQPVSVTGVGNFPAIYIQGSTEYKIRIEDGDGVLIIEYDELQGEVDTSGGGGGGGTTIPTGFEMPAYTTGAISGWVRENGRTIGSASSGATERANADCQPLFLHLWGIDANLAVSGGRGATAAADWAANKTIALPDARGRVLLGLDDMGSTAAGRLTGGLFSFGTATTLGSYGGAPTSTLVAANIPSLTGTTSSPLGFAPNYDKAAKATTAPREGTGSTITVVNDLTYTTTLVGNTDHTHTVTVNPGTATAHNILSPFSLRTVYIKL